MIIGISGKINSGKDTIGQIIQYLSTNPSGKQHHSKTITFDAFCKHPYAHQWTKCNWEIKKFASKIKEITALLIGCTVEQLEDREFKETPLGEEWDKFLIHNQLKEMAFENKNVIQAIFATENEAHDYILEIEKNVSHLEEMPRPHQILSIIKQQMTPRLLMQLLGTEAGRDIIHPNIWVNALFADYKSKPWGKDSETGKEIGMYPDWIITDVRFPNEAEAITDHGGILIRVNRYPETITEWIAPEKPKEIPFDINNPKHKKLWEGECKRQHPSETGLDDWEFEYIINNDGTIEELIEVVKDILLRETII